MFKRQLKSKPIRMWIDGKCFDIQNYNRKTNLKHQLDKKEEAEGIKEKNVSAAHVESKFIEKEIKSETTGYTNAVFHLVQNETGNWCTRFRLPKLYYNKLATFYKYDIEKLCDRTSTKINLPNNNDDHLTINGECKEKLIEAFREVLSVIGQIREQNMALQFISIPCLSKEIKENFEKFRTEILSDELTDGIHESIFQKAEKLHLTINVFVLLDEREVLEAIQTLDKYGKNVLSPLIAQTGPIRIRVSGLECMNENLKKVDVLYAKAKVCEEDEDKNLQKIADGIQEYFYERGLAKNYKDTVKLHMTLMNTKYRKAPTENPNKASPSPKKRRWVKRQSFDATKIMQKYRDIDFGECDLDSVHLSLMGSVDEETGFYKSLAVVRLADCNSSVVSDEIVRVKNPVSDEIVRVDNPVSDEIVRAENPVSDEIVRVDNPLSDEIVRVDNPVSDEIVRVDNPLSDEIVRVDNPLSDEIVRVDNPVSDKIV